MPALFTRMSSRPKRSFVVWIIARQAAGSATSTSSASVLAPSAVSSAVAAAALSRLRAAMTMVAPALARPRAMPSPMPPLPPVTSATRPVRSNGLAAMASASHALLRERGDARGPDRALLVVEPAFADRDAPRLAVVAHLEADPLGRRQPVQIEGDVAVDPGQALVA